VLRRGQETRAERGGKRGEHMALGFLCVSVLILAVVAVSINVLKRHRQTFNEHFPPLSDGAFLARCTPGTNPRVALKVRRIVADSLGVNYEQVYPSSRFVEDLGAD
jgi:hypothetical protein